MGKIALNLSKLTLVQTLQLGNDIKTAMTGNANFASPIPTLASVGTTITTGQSKLSAWEMAVMDTAMKLTERDTAHAALRASLTQLAGYVEAASGGDEAKIQSAGMPLRIPDSPATVPAQVTDLSLTAGDNEGELDGNWDANPLARCYEVQTCVDPITPGGWVSHPSVTKSKTTVSGLTMGSRVWMRVRAVGTGGIGAWSDPAVKTVP